MGKPVNRTLEIAAIGKDASGIGHVAGPVVSFRGKGDPLRSLLVNIDPVQDLHGYDNPWPAGGGKNKLPLGTKASETISGVTAKLEDGVITLSGTATADVTFEFPLITSVDLSPSTNKIAFLNSQDKVNVVLYFMRSGTTIHYWTMSPANRVGSNWMDTGNEVVDSILVKVSSGTGVSMTVSPMLIAIAETNYSYAPYSNSCPISGWSEINVWLKPTYDPTANPTATIQLGQTVYGGTLDATNGGLTVDRAIIPSYNGETLPGEWISDRDVYAPGTTPTIGAQVVYTLATPITIPLTPTQITTLQGQNNVMWADAGDVDVEYSASGGPGGKLALLLRNRKELLIALKMGMTQEEAGLLGSLPGVSLGSGLSPGIIRPGASTQDEDEEEELL